MNNLTTQIKTTKELSSSELLAILKARVDVFVVEQKIVLIQKLMIRISTQFMSF